MNLKKFLLDDKHLAPKPAPVAGRRRGATNPQPENAVHSMLLATVTFASIVVLALSIIFGKGTADSVIVDPETLCPVDMQYITQETYVHIDLSEKLNKNQRDWLKELLVVAQNNQFPPRSLFSISQMQTKPTAPRVEVQRFCIPNISDIDVAGSRIKKEDCPEIAEEEFDWNQNRTRHIGKALQGRIVVACENYVRLKEKVQAAANRYKNVSVEQNRSYIIGSIEEIMSASKHAGNSRIPTQLIVFSDMLQNAEWFSQYNTDPAEWTAKNLKKLRKGESAIKELGGKPPPANMKFNKVLLCVIPSAHSVLATARNQNAHEAMWKNYFESKVVHPSPKDLQFIPASACAVAAGALMK